MQPAALDVISALYEAFDVATLGIPGKHLTAERRADQLVLDGWVEVALYYFRRVLQGLKQALPPEDVPDLDSIIPRGARETGTCVILSGRRAEAQTRDRCLMAAQDFKELAGPQTPQVDVIRFDRASGNNVSTLFNCQAAELSGLRSRHRPVVAVLDQVVGTHSPIQAG